MATLRGRPLSRRCPTWTSWRWRRRIICMRSRRLRRYGRAAMWWWRSPCAWTSGRGTRLRTRPGSGTGWCAWTCTNGMTRTICGSSMSCWGALGGRFTGLRIWRSRCRFRRARSSGYGRAIRSPMWGRIGWIFSITTSVPLPTATGPLGPEQVVGLRDPSGDTLRVNLFRYRPLMRVTHLFGEMVERLGRRGVSVANERALLTECRRRLRQEPRSENDEREFLGRVRLAKRSLMLRDPDLVKIERILCVRRLNYEPSHNYSDLLDATGGPGGSVDIVTLPRVGGQLRPDLRRVQRLCDARGGVVRDAAADYDLRRIYFAWRRKGEEWFHLMEVRPDGTGLKQLTSGPFHDLYPTPLPDGGLAFISTRCRARYLCWRSQAYVLFRMARTGAMEPLSYANLSEWAPSVMRDGRILWTRSEYQDKG